MIDVGISAVQIEMFGTRIIRCEVDSPRKDTGEGVAELASALRHAFPRINTLLLVVADALLDIRDRTDFDAATEDSDLGEDSSKRIQELKTIIDGWHREREVHDS